MDAELGSFTDSNPVSSETESAPSTDAVGESQPVESTEVAPAEPAAAPEEPVVDYRAKYEEREAQVGRFLQALRDDPAAVLERLGPQAQEATLKKLLASSDPHTRKVAEQWIIDQYQETKLTAEQKAERENQRLAEENKRYREAEEARVANERRQKATATLQAQFPEGLKTAGLKDTPEVRAAIWKRAGEDYRAGKFVSMADSCARYAAELEGHVGHRVGAMSPEALFKLLGEEGLRKLRKFDLERNAKGQFLPREGKGETPAPQQQKSSKGYLSLEDIEAQLKGF